MSASTGIRLNLKSYHFFNFNAEGLIQQQGDFFDATGMMNATSLQEPVTTEE